MKTLEINSQPFSLDKDYNRAFLKGSAWTDLFSPYKYVADSFQPTNEAEYMKFMLQTYCFIIIELKLYLCTHPNNSEAIKALAEAMQMKEQLETENLSYMKRMNQCVGI